MALKWAIQFLELYLQFFYITLTVLLLISEVNSKFALILNYNLYLKIILNINVTFYIVYIVKNSGHAGIGRQARLRAVWVSRESSSLSDRTSIDSGFSFITKLE